MIQIKTQNIPLETFSPLQEKKLEPNKSGEEFSIVFNASYNTHLETEIKSSEDKSEEAETSESFENIEETEEVENLKDVEDLENSEDEEIDWNNLGMFWLLQTQPTNEDIEVEESSRGDFLTGTLQVHHLDESLTEPLELETVKDTSTEVKEIAEELSEHLSTEEAYQNVPKDGFTMMLENGVEKNREYESLEALQTLEISRDKGAQGEDRISEENSQVDDNHLDKINVKDEKPNKFEQYSSEKITSKSEIKAMLDSKKEIETANSLDEQFEGKLTLKIDENKMLESDTKEVIEETKIEVIADEPLNPAFERGIEQLKNLRVFEPQTQKQKIIEVPETEWVNQMESIIIEEIHSENGMDKVSTTRIQLTPEHLGKMDIELVLKEKGLTARLVVEHTETKEWIEQKVAELRVKLSAQNIEVTEFQISITENSQNLLDAGMQGNPFFKEKEEPENQRKSLKYSSEKEPVVETIENKADLNAGRLSMWV